MNARQIEGFAAVPNWMVRDASISGRNVLVYASLASRSGLGGIFPSQATIAEETQLSERTVRTALRELEELGVIQRTRRRSAKRGRATGMPTMYTLIPNGPVQDEDEEPATVAGRSEGPATTPRGTGKSAQVAPLIEVEPDREVETSDVASDDLPKYSSEIIRLCDLLAGHVRENGHKVGVVGETWHAACDRLIRLDGYTVEQVEWMIRWATADEFWAANIRSMPTLREKFSTLVLQAKRKAQQSPTHRASSVIDMGRRLQQQADAQPRGIAS